MSSKKLVHYRIKLYIQSLCTITWHMLRAKICCVAMEPIIFQMGGFFFSFNCNTLSFVLTYVADILVVLVTVLYPQATEINQGKWTN